ncbi:MAG: dihydrolipoyl dehydrogenase [Simkaniaceae bacterium]
MSRKKFDLAIIGSGPGGYVAAIKAAGLGKKVALIEKGSLGGACLNVGCIPTKTLIANSQVLHKIQKADDYGIHVENISFDYKKMKERKDKVVSSICSSLEGLLKGHGVEILRGKGEFLSPREIKISGEESQTIYASSSIIATGSNPLDIPAFPCDHKKILDSTSILEMEALPRSIAIIGGGYIGCEFASLYAALGVEVIILEALDSIVKAQGALIASTLTSSLKKQGIEIRTGVVVSGIDAHKDGVTVKLQDSTNIKADIALVSVGRKLCTDNLGLQKAGVKIEEKGFINVNEKMETSVPGIYAIGDITAKAMLAHVASHQGIVAAINACGGESRMHYHAVPAVIFTHPEIATVGMTEEEAKEAGYEISTGKFPFQALGKSQAIIETEGFAHVIADKKTGQVLGAQAIGHDASSLIAEMTLAINNELTLDCIIDTIHAHPTLPEAWLEATLLAKGSPIHLPPKKRKT